MLPLRCPAPGQHTHEDTSEVRHGPAGASAKEEDSTRCAFHINDSWKTLSMYDRHIIINESADCTGNLRIQGCKNECRETNVCLVILMLTFVMRTGKKRHLQEKKRPKIPG